MHKSIYPAGNARGRFLTLPALNPGAPGFDTVSIVVAFIVSMIHHRSLIFTVFALSRIFFAGILAPSLVILLIGGVPLTKKIAGSGDQAK